MLWRSRLMAGFSRLQVTRRETRGLWDTSSSRLHARIGSVVGIYCLTFLPDGKTLVTGNHAGILQLWDVATGQERFVLDQHNSEIGTLAFSPDGTTLAAGTWEGKVWLYRAARKDAVQAQPARSEARPSARSNTFRG